MIPGRHRKEETYIKSFETNETDFLEEEPSPVESVDELPKERKKAKKSKKKKPHRGLRILAIILCLILLGEGAYCFAVFTDIGIIKYYREAYIDTALSTMTHEWLASYFLPEYMVESIRLRNEIRLQNQQGAVSERPAPTESTAPTEPEPTETEGPTDESIVNVDEEKEAFFELFWELNRTSFEEYVDEHPDVLRNGWDGIYINEAGQNDEGTDIYTSMGEQVLAVDAENGILLVRVSGTGYIGVLAIAKDSSQLRVASSAGIGSYGQVLGTIVENNDAVLGINGSGFYDPNGGGNGGSVAGYAMSEGVSYGSHYTQAGYKRIELTRDNKMYIADANSEVASDVTDAVEFSPALIVDGQILVGGDDWTSINPRACIGQSDKDEILMLVIEGRLIGRSIGAGLDTCAEILMRHRCYTAMNLDGGTTAVMYYDGEYVTRCSNQNIRSRSLPNAWVYGNYDEE